MFDGLKPYLEMKESGVPWTGTIPKHWKMLPNRALMRRRKVLVGGRHSEYRLLSLTKEGIIVRDVSSGKGKFSADMGTSQEVRIGDLVFCFFDIPETPRTVGLSRFDGMITGAYTVLECEDPSLAAFLDLFYRAMDDRKLLGPLYSGLRNTIPPTRFLGVKTPVPPSDEQAAIVRFLGYTGRIIRSYIRAKQRLIKLLEEQKQAIILRLVTHGLNSNVHLKPSGIRWLGDVAESWKIARGRDLGRVVRGGSPRPAGSALYFHGQAEPWITVGEVTKDSQIYLRTTSTKLTQLGVEHSRLVNPGTLLLTNSGATLGVPKITQISGCINDGVAAFLNVSPAVDKEYLYFYWLTQTSHLRTWVNLGAQPNLNTQIIGSWPVLVPPFQQQEEIVAAIKLQTEALDEIIRRTSRQIELVKEMSIRLISDVVTGTYDVRGAVGRLPEDTGEAERFDEISIPTEEDGGTVETDDASVEADI